MKPKITAALWTMSAIGAVLLSLLYMLPSLTQGQDQAQLLYDCKANNAVRILFIGNSFTYVNSLPLTLAALVSNSNTQPPATVAQVVWGGAKLAEHLVKGGSRKCIAQDGPWTYVVLQEQSQTPVLDTERFLSAVSQFNDDIARARSKTVLYETWSDKGKPDEQSGLTNAYNRAASQTRALLIPAGEAFALCSRDHAEINLYDADGHHPSKEGTYLAACVFYAKLFGHSPVGLPCNLTLYDEDTKRNVSLFALPTETAHKLQQIALTASTRR
ncbi:MAG TPA: hypothetical protein V6C89_18210 [Drouetiella sp.]|jgi:hypothetical protein